MGLGYDGNVSHIGHAILHGAGLQHIAHGNPALRKPDPTQDGPAPMVPAVIERMRKAVGVATDKELAEQLDIKPSTPSSWRSRDKFPLDECLALAIARGISLDWLLFGDGESQRDAGPALDSGSLVDSSAPSGHRNIDRLKGFDTTPGPDRLIIPSAVLDARLADRDINVGALRWMVNPDPAMAPTFEKGALLLVDSGITSREAIEDGETYVIRFATRLLVRRIFILGEPGNNEYRLAGFRPKEGRRDLTGPDYLHLEIGGRVVDVI